jgi:anti-anti-sigma regulatory factor
LIAIDVVGELDDVCIEMVRETIARAAQSARAIVVNVDGLDVTWPDTLASFGTLMQRVRQSGYDCTVETRERRMRSLLVRAGCGDALFASEPVEAAERRVIIARHLSHERRRPKRAVR